jgi:DNA ligase-1
MLDTPFSSFAELCASLESTTKRLEKRKMIADFLRALKPEEVPVAVSFLLGRPFPESDERVLDLGGNTLWRLPASRQMTLVGEPLTIKDIVRCFNDIAGSSGTGSRGKKELLLEGLLGRASGAETTYILRIISGEMRLGAVEGIVMEAIADASCLSPELIQRANMLKGNLGEVAVIAIAQGERLLEALKLSLFTPIKPMLAEMSYDLQEVLKEHGGTTALEYKFDGARVQIHKKGGEVRIYSRRLSDVTRSLPELEALARAEIKAEDTLVEGEVIALGEDGKPLPFQDLMRRFKRIRGVNEAQKNMPVRLYLFDILYKDGAEYIDKPYAERWHALVNTAAPHLLAPRIVTRSVKEAEAFLKSSIASGHEGLMAKALDQPYSMGVRGKSWFKIKPFETLDLAIVAAEWGYGRREHWLSNYHLAARDEESGEFVMLGKTFKGLTDNEFSSMTDELLRNKLEERGNTVFVKPTVLVEVAYNEIQRSPRYKAGFALRFARILRIRDDKGPCDADTMQKVKALFRRKFDNKGVAV